MKALWKELAPYRVAAAFLILVVLSVVAVVVA